MKTSVPTLLVTLCVAITMSLTLLSLASAAVYKVTDDQGNITYTDTAPAEAAADKVQLPPVNKIPTLTPAAATPPDSTDTELSPAFNGYSFAALVSPVNDSLVHFDQSQVLAQLALTPELGVDHLVQFYVDGSTYGHAGRRKFSFYRRAGAGNPSYFSSGALFSGSCSGYCQARHRACATAFQAKLGPIKISLHHNGAHNEALAYTVVHNASQPPCLGGF